MKFLSKLIISNQFFYQSFTKWTSIVCVTVFVTLFSLLFSPRKAEAAFFSFFSDLLGDKVSANTVDNLIDAQTEVSSGVDPVNSQNIALLHAAINSDPNPNNSANDPIIALGNALVAEIGPSGTVAEVESQFSTQISLYTVRKGDTLSEIAEMFGVSINTIGWANELGKNPIIREGQILVILPISGVRYTVKRGDTIRGIVLRHKADLEEVLQFNELTLSSTIVPGDIIVIPDAEPTVDSSKIATHINTQSSGKNPYYPGYYVRPIDGGVKTQGIHGYNGVDLAAPVGTPIHASASGKVIASINNGAWNGGYGNYVIIYHSNETYTLYAHTQKNFVRVGDSVEQGQMIAKIGMTGKTTGPHLHFEIRGAKNPF